MTLEQLLKMKVKCTSPVTGDDVEMSPEFRVAVQNVDAEIGGERGVHVIIHANGHNSRTLDLLVSGNKVWKVY